MSIHVSVIRYSANIVPQDIQDLISYPDLLLTKLCQQIFFKFFFSCRYLLLIGCTLNGMRSNYVAKCSASRTRSQKISPVTPRQKNGWTTRIYRNTSEDPELLKKRTLSKCRGNWQATTNWEHFFYVSWLRRPPPPFCFWVDIRATRKSTLFAEQRLCLLPPLFITLSPLNAKPQSWK